MCLYTIDQQQLTSSVPAHWVSASTSGDTHQKVGGDKEKEDDSPLKEQLNKAWKRIADLETRVHDLTLQSTVVSEQ